VHFFEYRLGMADDIALKMGQATQEYQDAILPPFTKALFKYVEE
jgi:lysine decarboxylase